jgi:hypothetical protein
MTDNVEKKPTIVSIDGVEYQLESMNDKQRVLLNHVADIDGKLASAKFSLEQLQVARDAFFGMLKRALVESETQSVEEVSAK